MNSAFVPLACNTVSIASTSSGPVPSPLISATLFAIFYVIYYSYRVRRAKYLTRPTTIPKISAIEQIRLIFSRGPVYWRTAKWRYTCDVARSVIVTASTDPSSSFLTHPTSPLFSANALKLDLKKTPCTRPTMRRLTDRVCTRDILGLTNYFSWLEKKRCWRCRTYKIVKAFTERAAEHSKERWPLMK